MISFIFHHCDWVALFFSIVGLWFNGRKSMKCWPCWFTSNIVWAVYATTTRQPSLLILQVLFFAFNVIGYLAWKKDAAAKQIKDEADSRLTQAWISKGYGMSEEKRRSLLEGTFDLNPSGDFQGRDRRSRDKYGNPR